MSGKRVIIDADLLSMFAKVDAVDLLEGFLGRGRVAMTPAIRDEISIPLQYGYTFPKTVLSQIPVVPLSEHAWEEYERLWAVGSSLGKGELEAIAFCRTEEALFATLRTILLLENLLRIRACKSSPCKPSCEGCG